MESKCEIVEIGIVLYQDVQLAAVHGLTDLFKIANEQAMGQAPLRRKKIRVSHWGFSDREGEYFSRVFDSETSETSGAKSRPDFLIIPPSLAEPISKQSATMPASWLKKNYAAGATLCSICAGVFLLAETDLLNERLVTTHWGYASELARRFPKVKVDTDQLLLHSERIVTAGGLMAWLDLGLHLVERAIDASAMFATARFLVVSPAVREQKSFASFIPALGHGDAEILIVQKWLKENESQDVNLIEMAKKTGLKERTFIRRFIEATGMRPTEYCQHLRINKARDMLELTDQSVEEISWAVGYENSGALRKIFVKNIGLSPSEYRKKTNPHNEPKKSVPPAKIKP